MKKLIIIFLLISVKISIAQTKKSFDAPIVSAVKTTYSVTDATNLNLKIVHNTENKLMKRGMNPPKNAPRIKAGDIKIDVNRIAQICWNVFGEARIKQFATESNDMDDFLTINFDTDTKGKIIEIYFAFRNQLSVTPVELEKLEQSLKDSIQIQLNPQTFAGYSYFTVRENVWFKKLINHQPDAVN